MPSRTKRKQSIQAITDRVHTNGKQCGHRCRFLWNSPYSCVLYGYVLDTTRYGDPLRCSDCLCFLDNERDWFPPEDNPPPKYINKRISR